ncbi:hypothetical protein H1R20_g16651, partial [Candolleomyces eurysporus]
MEAPPSTPVSILYSRDTPNAELWEALAQARASHLELISHSELAAWDGEQQCNYAGLGKLSLEPGAWPLKSLYVDVYRGDGAWNGAEGAEQKPSFPAIFANIETLVLLWPDKDSLYFYPEGGAAILRSLTVISGASVQTLNRTVECNPRIADTLASLTLSCKLPQTSGSARRMKELFKEEIRSLQRFELGVIDRSHFKRPAEYLTSLKNSVGYGETMEDCANAHLLGLSTVLPSSLVTLSYKGPANSLMLQDLDQWVEDAASPSWLPNLRTIAFELAPLQDMKESKNLGEDQMEQLKQKLEKFWALMRQRHPPIVVVNPRGIEELRFPLSI